MSDAPPPAASRWDDYLDIFIAPSRAFERRRDGHFGHAMLVFIVLVGLIYFGTRSAMEPIYMAEFERGMRSRPGVTPEQIEQMRGMAGMFGLIFVFVGTPIVMFVTGLVTFVAARLASITVTVAQAIAIVALSNFPRLIGAVVGALQALLMDEQKLTSQYVVHLGPARFMDPETGSKLLLAVAGRADLFTLWLTVLIGLGLKVVGKSSTGQAVAAAALVWAVGAIPTLFQALR